jgi:4-aminobutyrate aminotransferase-like enzyme
MSVLNTNTRYLHDLLVEYSERLVATLPDPLSVVYFVCTGSEANELALRMARTHTGRRDVIVVDGAYHGNTSALVDLSPYKFQGAGGEGAPDWVHTTLMPDPYRGRFRALQGDGIPGDPEAPLSSGPSPQYLPAKDLGHRYAEDVREVVEKIQAQGREPAAFFCESLLGCGGQIVLPDGYMAKAFGHVREAGGVCIADEVQVGFGRAGTHFWAFETQGAVPDIVTLGKPMGNGHPVAAVVTTPEIASSFSTGMEYFNTFGGNPVSCAVGMAVMDVIQDEGLQENARLVGGHLLEKLREMMHRHPVMGDVRGIGLYIGVELVEDRVSREPAPRRAARAKERLRDHRILLSTDGPQDNVLKIKPPLVFSIADAHRFLSTLDRILEEDGIRV